MTVASAVHPLERALGRTPDLEAAVLWCVDPRAAYRLARLAANARLNLKWWGRGVRCCAHRCSAATLRVQLWMHFGDPAGRRSRWRALGYRLAALHRAGMLVHLRDRSPLPVPARRP